MPPSVQRSNAKHYKSKAITEIREYEGYGHLLPAQEGLPFLNARLTPCPVIAPGR